MSSAPTGYSPEKQRGDETGESSHTGTWKQSTVRRNTPGRWRICVMDSFFYGLQEGKLLLKVLFADFAPVVLSWWLTGWVSCFLLLHTDCVAAHIRVQIKDCYLGRPISPGLRPIFRSGSLLISRAERCRLISPSVKSSWSSLQQLKDVWLQASRLCLLLLLFTLTQPHQVHVGMASCSRCVSSLMAISSPCTDWCLVTL